MRIPLSLKYINCPRDTERRMFSLNRERKYDKFNKKIEVTKVEDQKQC